MTVDYITFSNLIIDDIVFPDGRTFMNILGGAGLHALVGMRVWNAHLGYAAAVGPDLDPTHRKTLDKFGVDLLGLVLRDNFRTARAWQLFEPDERRIEIFRTSLTEFNQFKVRADELPASYHQARGFHLQWGTLPELGELIRLLREAKPDITLVLEPTTENLEEPAAAYQKVLPYLDLFSPDMGEAEMITGRSEPEAMCEALFSWGVPLVALRMGERGSLVKTPNGESWRIPAVPPTTLVDVTGAGNSYCGGFLTGLGDGLTPLEASLRAAVSASFALEQFGLPDWQSGPSSEEVLRRMAWAKERVEVQ
jgi:sugar/nucleoside kinase (ribokinase family)